MSNEMKFIENELTTMIFAALTTFIQQNLFFSDAEPTIKPSESAQEVAAAL